MLPKVIATMAPPESVSSQLSDFCELLTCDPATGVIPDEWLQSADGMLCTLNTPVTAGLFSRAPQLKVVSSVSVGVDHIDLDAATAAAVPVGNTPGVLVDSTADLALGLMLAVTRRLPEADQFVRKGEWTNAWSTGFFLGTDLSRSTVGLIGLGPIGQAVAKRALAFGARVIGWTRTPREIPGVELMSMDEVLSGADITSLHTALVPETRNLIGARELALMKPGAILINTARGGLIDEPALVDVLQAGRLKAGLDVFAEEPLPANSPLLTTPNTVLVPHLGSATAATRQAMLDRAVINLRAGLAGEPLPYCVNPEAYDA
ncbi:glyoxylate reductase [Luminiphilus syltensis NOR5-1B]|uniref:Glyoxylate reductase n=1 Tax=Luminiphilus syltensis NOR5-1B TaxID=565045 RepID=B8KTN8_9GAMM|nr:D-glycerate dehydrogenase [Luminiphilus syltensis]EED35192.1 glyoxylate reductase [Luminiphilus syltensis NOR5-1B]